MKNKTKRKIREEERMEATRMHSVATEIKMHK